MTDTTGSKVAFEAARALAGCKLARSVRLLFFSNEEKGIVGATAYVNSIKSGQVESGFAQSDVTYWAYTGTGPFEGRPPVKS